MPTTPSQTPTAPTFPPQPTSPSATSPPAPNETNPTTALEPNSTTPAVPQTPTPKPKKQKGDKHNQKTLQALHATQARLAATHQLGAWIENARVIRMLQAGGTGGLDRGLVERIEESELGEVRVKGVGKKGSSAGRVGAAEIKKERREMKVRNRAGRKGEEEADVGGSFVQGVGEMGHGDAVQL
ncbi:hypothetical protein K490DRAFT_63527 [Saccharata proteae CBS 121410]|uniref:Uncharacterized protein n=1 Tax=Saccharata proteae CBS 121410 TaxID=1314787 RepID=A0A6A5YF19_9PEZI|nr:hypothetical protein K490DRAFT_63527 [Saccharata proteae CBS 121410]